MTSGLLARRKMVMIPTFRGHEETSGLPIDPNELSPWGPHERITFSRYDDDLGSRPMTMRFFVGTRLDGHDVTDHGVAGQVNTQATETNPALRMRIQRNRVEVGNEIDDPVFLLPRLEIAAKEIFLSGETVGKFVRHVENKIRRIVDVHHQRQIVGRGDTNRVGRGT